MCQLAPKWASLSKTLGFPGSLAGKESAYNAGDPGSIPGLGGFPWRRDRLPTPLFLGFPSGLRQLRICLQRGRPGFHPLVGKIPWRKALQPTPVFLPGESPWTAEPDGLQSVGQHRFRRD